MTDNLISRLEEIPQSGDDLVQMAKCLGAQRVKYILYDDLKKYNNLKELFGGSLSIYILLQIKNLETGDVESVGHWVCFIHHEDRGVYYYYDPYGLSIEQELAITHEEGLIRKFTSQARVEVNSFQHQEFSDEVNVCGRWCVLRSIFYHLNNLLFDELVVRSIKHILKPDELVALVTGLISTSDAPLVKFYNKQEDEKKLTT